MSRLLGVMGVLFVLGAVGTSCSGTVRQCGFDAGLCPQGELCVEPELVCAQPCGGDGGTACPAGTTCQTSGTYCGSSCDGMAAPAMVCK